MTLRIGIVGAGMAGLSCARALSDAGLSVTVLDKSRGVGGRLATRRAMPDLQFDHGAQYVTARNPGFHTLLQDACGAGGAGVWPMGDRDGFVGMPAMNSLTKFLAKGLDVQREFQVQTVQRDDNQWVVLSPTGSLTFDILILTAPAPQTATLLGSAHTLSQEIRPVRMLPCWTLMATFSAPADVDFVARRTSDAPLAWIALDSSKPGRTSPSCWVAQASPDWSDSHLEDDKGEVSNKLLSMLCETLHVAPENVLHADAHRWRYAKVDRPYGNPFLKDETGSLYLGGDWCLGARVEAAWQSGTAIAHDLRERLAC